MDARDYEHFVPQIMENVKEKTGRTAPFSHKLSLIKDELRQRRKRFLGSYVRVRDFVLSDSGVDDKAIELISCYLASKSLHYWKFDDEDAERFFFRFYRLTLYALASGRVRGECIDDIFQLAECLLRSKKVFVVAMKDMLPEDMIGELFDFIDTSEESYFNLSFTDAVLGGTCVFLGALSDYDPETEPDDNEEG